MGLFNSKPKMTIEDFCKAFYDSHIFTTKTIPYSRETEEAPKDFWAFYLTEVKKMVTEADQSFSAIDTDLFWREMTALYMEVFALACSAKVKWKQDLMVRQGLFTKYYLEDNAMPELWDAMHSYREAIDDSILAKANGQLLDGNSRLGRGKVTFWNSFRFDLWKDWIKSNVVDPQSPSKEEKEKLECLAIALKRVGADIRRADCVAVKMLAFRLAQRLGCDSTINREAKFQLATVVFGFCTRAENHLKSVDLQ